VINGLIGRLGLAARIGAAIAAAVIAIQVLVTLVFLMHPPNFHPFYSARWLSGSAVEIIKNAMAGATEPSSALRNLPNPESLSVRFDHAPPRRATSDPPRPLNWVLATVQNRSSRLSNRSRGSNPRATGRPAARGSVCRSLATLCSPMAARSRSPTLPRVRADLSSAFSCQKPSRQLGRLRMRRGVPYDSMGVSECPRLLKPSSGFRNRGGLEQVQVGL
jgi:hypothetical protein